MEESELIREAMRAIGRRTSERKKQASQENGKKGGTHVLTETQRENLRKAQRQRRARERGEVPEDAL